MRFYKFSLLKLLLTSLVILALLHLVLYDLQTVILLSIDISIQPELGLHGHFLTNTDCRLSECKNFLGQG